MQADAYKLLKRMLDTLQRSKIVRNVIAALIILSLTGLVGYFIYSLVPRHYRITLTGGEMLGNRHYLAKIVQGEAAKRNVSIILRSSAAGTLNILQKVNEGQMDMAFVQGGVEKSLPQVEHVATLMPELLHVLVKPNIKQLSDLKGKIINLGSKAGGTRIVAQRVLNFCGFEDGVDYIETNYSAEDLVNMHPGKVPDVIMVLSFAPSYIADYFVKERGYLLLEMPFPPSLALRYGWAGEGKILAYTYSVAPPIPNKDISTVGVNLQLVANSKVDPKAVANVLDALFSPVVESKLHQKLNPSNIMLGSVFPLSAGTVAYLKRNDPILSLSMLDSLKNFFGLFMAFASAILVIVKWLRGLKSDTDVIKGYIRQVMQIEQQIGIMEEKGAYNLDELNKMSLKLTTLKSEVLDKFPRAKLDDPGIVDKFLASVGDARNYVTVLMGRAKDASPGSSKS